MRLDWKDLRLDFDLYLVLGGVRIGRRELEGLRELLRTGDVDVASSSVGITSEQLLRARDALAGALGKLDPSAIEEITQILEQKRVLVHGCIRGLKRPSIAVDMVVLRGDSVLLVRRGRAPYKGYYALPGGFVEYGERVEEAAVRELREETGVEAELIEQFGVYSDPMRDPRGHTISVAFLLKYLRGAPMGGDDARNAAFFPLDRVPPLAFDHSEILRDGLLAAARRGLL